jgi:hypothetical protein
LAFLPEFNWGEYGKLVKIHGFEQKNKLFFEILNKTKNIKELGINNQKMAKMKKEITKKSEKIF